MSTTLQIGRCSPQRRMEVFQRLQNHTDPKTSILIQGFLTFSGQCGSDKGGYKFLNIFRTTLTQKLLSSFKDS
jgi:hypothetical protein